jgi:hypothetical protein
MNKKTESQDSVFYLLQIIPQAIFVPALPAG